MFCSVNLCALFIAVALVSLGLHAALECFASFEGHAVGLCHVLALYYLARAVL